VPVQGAPAVVFVGRYVAGVSNAGDEPRLLARRSELGYVAHVAGALHGEPEAIPASVQAELSLRARRGAEQRQRVAGGDARRQIVPAIEDFGRVAEPRVRGHLRALSRAVARVDAELRP
jgi:hypothetical protein